MKADVLLGLQWGDEGKGKIVDVITPGYDMVCRFQGGPNAGHTLEFNGIKHVLHIIPSGIFRENCMNVVGNGVVLDPVVFHKEISALRKMGVEVEKKLLISNRAHLILPSHRLLDAASESAKGKEKIGSTLKGIGPTYMDKTGRNGLRVGDIKLPNFKEKYQQLVNKHRQILDAYGFTYNLQEHEPEFFRCVEELNKLNHIDGEHFLNAELAKGKTVLAEGAQGSLLDIDFGTYPFVTSSNTICAGACTGLGIAPSRIGRVLGIFKAYCTRVGSGPFPTELTDDTGELIRKTGNEFGSTTGRPRRCGWLDLPALKYAIMINGVTELIMMKADVLNPIATIKVCTHYEVGGKKTDQLPFDLCQVEARPVYKELKGWNRSLESVGSAENMPRELLDYIHFIETETGVPVSIVSVGPDRKQTIIRNGVLV
ncbi:MAG: adenylosuccinate synthase [Bacteroidia bacterium]|nr:adenylosuccinate synthase [Bacteroidia bacterium]